jgi:hypothetical protein
VRTWPTPTRKDHETFCRQEAWQQVRNARGSTGTHHVIYELPLADGRILRTRTSHPIDRTDYGRGMWGHILPDQLQVSEEVFWACVQDGTKPDRGGPPEPPAEALPAEMVHLLINKVGLDEATVAAMSKADAVTRLQQYWTTGQ